MCLLLVRIAMAAAPVADEVDAQYLAETARADDAVRWYVDRIAAEPDEPRWVVDWLEALTQLPQLRSPALPWLAERWRADHPDAADAGVVVALAHGLAAWPEGHMRMGASPYPDGGAWCGPASEALATAPEDPGARYAVLRERRRVDEACGLDLAAIEAEMLALGSSGDAGPLPQAWWAIREGTAAPEAEAFGAALDEAPWKAVKLTGAFLGDRKADPLLEPVRAELLARARTWAAEERPARAWSAAGVLTAAGLTDEALAALETVERLDPENRLLASRMAFLRSPRSEAPTAGEEAPSASTVIDPGQRMAALLVQDPGKGWDAVVHWTAVAEAARATGDVEADLDALDRLWRVSPSDEPNLRFAEAAVEAGERLRTARRAAEIAVSTREAPPAYRGAPDDAWRADLSEALDVRARVWEALDRPKRVRADLERALALTEPTADRELRLGLLYADQGWDGAALPVLARALARWDGPDDARTQQGAEALAAALAASGAWAPGGVDGYLAAIRASEQEPAEASAPEALDAGPFDALSVTLAGPDGALDGEPERLLDIEGPLVVDLWATWCGPCMESLPHLDALARQYTGRVTFLAVSVDSEPAKASRYLAKRGEHGFVSAFAGAEAMRALGVDGIPAMFVFDAEHRLVAKLSGWGPGNTALDEAVEAMSRGAQ